MENVIDSSNFFESNDNVELFARSPKSGSSSSSSSSSKSSSKSTSKKSKKSKGGKGAIIVGVIVLIIIIIIAIIIIRKKKSRKGKTDKIKSEKPEKVEKEEEPEAIVIEDNNNQPIPPEGNTTQQPIQNETDNSQQYQPLQYQQGAYPPAPAGPYQPMNQGYPQPPMPPMNQGYPPQGFLATQPPASNPPVLTDLQPTSEPINPESITAMPKVQ